MLETKSLEWNQMIIIYDFILLIAMVQFIEQIEQFELYFGHKMPDKTNLNAQSDNNTICVFFCCTH